MNHFLFFTLFTIISATANAQRNYADAIRQGDEAFNKQQYKTAINKYFAAEAFDPGKKDSVKRKVNIVFDQIEALRKKAEDALKEAKKQTRIAQANSLISEAKTLLADDPTLALRLAEQAIKLDNVSSNREFAAKIYRENEFYKIIQAPDGEPFSSIYPWIGIPSVAFAKDGLSILTGTSNDSFARLWNIKGELIMQFKASSYITAVAISPNGQEVLTGARDGSAQLWGITGEKRWLIPTDFREDNWEVSSLGFSPDGQTILTGSSFGYTRLWKINSKTPISYFDDNRQSKWRNSLASFSTDGNLVLLVGGGNASLFKRDGSIQRKFKIIDEYNSLCSISPDGQSIIMTGKDSVYLLDTGGSIKKSFKTGSHIRSVAFSPSGNTILTGLSDGTAELWNLNGVLEMKFKGHSREITSVAFSPDGRSILTGSLDRTARLWDLNGNIKTRLLEGDKDSILKLGFQIPEEYRIDEPVTPSRELLKKMGPEFSRLTKSTTSIVASVDGKTILTGPEPLRLGGNMRPDYTGRLWDSTGVCIQEFENVKSVSFSSDSKSIISFNNNAINIWNVKMPLNDFFKSNKMEPLSTEQKKKYGITESLLPVTQKKRIKNLQ